MKILLTGATGYIGKRLFTVLIEQGHELICCVRNKNRFYIPEEYKERVTLFEVDFSKPVDIFNAPIKFDVAYYLIHSLASSIGKFEDQEINVACNFVEYLSATTARQQIYLTGIVNAEHLSPHLESRKKVEDVLSISSVPLTVIRAGIIVGSGSASFEIIRDLVEKLPAMITPKWVKNKIQPIGVHDVMKYLSGVLLKKECMGKSFEIGGPEILTYKEMMQQYAEVRDLKRTIITLPVLTPRLSSYWLYFITSTSYNIAVNLVESMKVEVITKENKLEEILKVNPMSYKEAVKLAFHKIEENMVISSWKDSFVSSAFQDKMMHHIQIPENGILKDIQKKRIEGNLSEVKERVWSIGGNTGWYYAGWLWKLRGFIDRLVGGVGLRRGRTHLNRLYNGDALDFWRVLLSDKKAGRLLLYSEMKVPGEAWLEFKLINKDGNDYLTQRAIFRPDGILGRLYWYAMFPFHFFIFKGLLNKLVKEVP